HLTNFICLSYDAIYFIMKTTFAFKFQLVFCVCLFSISFLFGQQLTEKANLIGVDHTFEPRSLMGGGAAFFDFDNDGFEDLYLTSGTSKDVLYHNNGDGTFTKVLSDVGLNITQQYNTTAVITGDIDNDGDRELFIATWERYENGNDIIARNLLFNNNGNGTFTEIGEAAGITHPSFTIGANFLDFDRDGWLDIYVLNHIETPGFLFDSTGVISGFDHDCYPNFFYKNNGDGTFTEMATDLGLEDLSCTLASIASDFDLDGDVDLYLANDFGPFIVPNLFFENQYPNTGFVESGASNGSDVAMYGMGVALSDYDHDGDFDYYITNLGSNVLLENDNANFTNVAATAGVENEFATAGEFATGWGTAFLDIDNDTWEDLFVANGRIPSLPSLPTAMNDPNRLFMNNGDKTFTDVSEQVGVNDPSYSRGMAYSDFDLDGDLDMVVVNLSELGGITKFYVNETETNHHYIQFKLKGTASNRDAFGSKIWLYADGATYMREISGGGDSFCSQHSSIAHFGLGTNDQVDSLRVEWLSGTVEHFGAFEVDALHEIEEGGLTAIDSDLGKETFHFSVQPNPFQNEIILSSPKDLNQEVQIALWDVNNKLIKTFILNWNGDAQKLALPSALPKGMYFLHITSQDQVWTSKLIKQ
ncbi:MAG: FG-GAP-like repeat-containing protein, partial [Bacteroidota bacterium]